MKALTLTFALLLICTGAALAQTPDWMTHSEETICDGETGAAFGLCNAYCEAMDCESANAQASPTACTKVRDKFMNITGHDLPCESAACPCSGIPEFNAVLAGNVMQCFSYTGGFDLRTDTGGLMLIVQYPGPTTGGRPIYDKRFNMERRRAR